MIKYIISSFIIILASSACGEVSNIDPDASSLTADSRATVDGPIQVDAAPDIDAPSPDAAVEPPETIITAKPRDPSNDMNVTFEFDANVEDCTFECRLDNGTWAPCTSPHSIMVNESPHSFRVGAINNSGIKDPTPEIYNWRTDLTPPVLTIAGPPNPTQATNASFSFSANEAVNFECRLDGGDYAPCTSPYVTMGLTPGMLHTFYVRATDLAENTTTENHQWFIQYPCMPYEIEAEDDSIVTRSAGWSVAFGGLLHDGQGLTTNSSNSTAHVDFNLNGTGLIVLYENGPNRGNFTVSINGGSPVLVEGYATSFNFQVPAVIASGMPNGTHSIRLQCVANTGYCSPDYFKVTCE